MAPFFRVLQEDARECHKRCRLEGPTGEILNKLDSWVLLRRTFMAGFPGLFVGSGCVGWLVWLGLLCGLPSPELPLP